jgi:hypothetical protein
VASTKNLKTNQRKDNKNKQDIKAVADDKKIY